MDWSVYGRTRPSSVQSEDSIRRPLNRLVARIEPDCKQSRRATAIEEEAGAQPGNLRRAAGPSSQEQGVNGVGTPRTAGRRPLSPHR